MSSIGAGFEGGPFGASPSNAMWDDSPSESDPNRHETSYGVFDDFFEYDATATVGRWVSVKDAGGTILVLDDVAGGQLRLTCAATTDNDGNQASFVSAPFYLAAGKHLRFEARIKMVEATQSDLQVGLVALGEDLTGVADNFAADGILFTCDDAATAIQFTASKGGTNTGQLASVGTLVDDTWIKLGFVVNGVTSITPYVNGVAGQPITATIPDDEALAPFFGVRNGDGTIQNLLTVDWVKAIQLR